MHQDHCCCTFFQLNIRYKIGRDGGGDCDYTFNIQPQVQKLLCAVDKARNMSSFCYVRSEV